MTLRDSITLQEDPVWTDYYEQQRDRIGAVLETESVLGMFHVGSTAIPGVPGKPALDVVVVFTDEAALTAGADALADAGFELPHRERETAVAVEWGEERTVFVKLHTPNDPRVRAQLLFRDYLRDHPRARERYAEVKRQSVADHPTDEEAYTNAKHDVVLSVVEQAREDGYEADLPDCAR